MASPVGRLALVKMSGTGVAVTAQAFTDSGDHQTYQITTTTRRVWDATIVPVVKVAGVTTVETYTINRLLGKVIFATIDAGRGAVTADLTYLPMTTVAKAKKFSYAITNEALDDTTFDSAGWTERINGIKDISGSVGRNYQTSTDALFRALVVSGAVAVLQIFHTSTSAADILAWVRFDKQDTNVATHAIIDQMIDFVGVADADNRVVSIA